MERVKKIQNSRDCGILTILNYLILVNRLTAMQFFTKPLLTEDKFRVTLLLANQNTFNARILNAITC